MNKIMLGFVAAVALVSFTAPVFAEDAPAADGAPKKEKKGKKKGEKKAAEGDAAPAGDAKK